MGESNVPGTGRAEVDALLAELAGLECTKVQSGQMFNLYLDLGPLQGELYRFELHGTPRELTVE